MHIQEQFIGKCVNVTDSSVQISYQQFCIALTQCTAMSSASVSLLHLTIGMRAPFVVAFK